MSRHRGIGVGKRRDQIGTRSDTTEMCSLIVRYGSGNRIVPTIDVPMAWAQLRSPVALELVVNGGQDSVSLLGIKAGDPVSIVECSGVVTLVAGKDNPAIARDRQQIRPDKSPVMKMC